MQNFDFDNVAENNGSIVSQMAKVYGWMFLGLLVTGITALYTASSPALLDAIYSSRFTFLILIIAEVAFVWFLSSRVMKMEFSVAAASFMLYSVLNGLTMSIIFIAYTGSSIGWTFFMTAGFFGVMSVYGLVTKTDLTSMRSFLIMGLIGVIIASIFNVFLNSSTLYWVISFVGVAVFLGLTAYDNQKIKDLHSRYAGTEKVRNVAVLGALVLYLDFINLFLLILRVLGRRR